jgi:hypothetical protein
VALIHLPIQNDFMMESLKHIIALAFWNNNLIMLVNLLSMPSSKKARKTKFQITLS